MLCVTCLKPLTPCFLQSCFDVERITVNSLCDLQGGYFKLLLTLPTEYPFKPPLLNFGTKIYHPNVSNDGKGSMCLGMLRSDEWKPPNKIAAVLDMVRSILVEPNAEDAVEASVAEVYKRDRKEFERTAKDWTKRYASKK